MKRLMTICLLSVLCGWAAWGYDEFSKTEPISDASFTVTVNGAQIPVYQAKAQYDGGIYYFASFTLAGTSNIQIKSDRPLTGAKVLPISAGITPRINGHKMSFKASEPFKISIECEGRVRPLLLFANPARSAIDTSAVIYYGPGVHHVGLIDLKAGQTLYLAEGAIVNAGIHIEGDNVTVCGGGILTGDDYKRWDGPTGCVIEGKHCKNLTIKDIVLTNPWGWCIAIWDSDGVNIDNVKICGSCMINDDALDICNSRNVKVSNCFMRVQDDIIAVKGMRYGSLPSEHILIENCQFWSDMANIWRIGYECDAPYFKDIVSRNIDVIHYSRNYRDPDDYWANAVVWLQPSGGLRLSDVTFENIDVNADGYNIIMLEAKSCLNAGPSCNGKHYPIGGSISNVIYKNFKVTGSPTSFGGYIWIEGLSEQESIQDIAIDMTYFGKKIEQTDGIVHIGQFVSNVKF
jgi:hypothetical protein